MIKIMNFKNVSRCLQGGLLSYSPLQGTEKSTFSERCIILCHVFVLRVLLKIHGYLDSVVTCIPTKLRQNCNII